MKSGDDAAGDLWSGDRSTLPAPECEGLEGGRGASADSSLGLSAGPKNHKPEKILTPPKTEPHVGGGGGGGGCVSNRGGVPANLTQDL